MKKLLVLIVPLCFLVFGCDDTWRMDDQLTRAICDSNPFIYPCPEIFDGPTVRSFTEIHADGYGVISLAHVDQCENVQFLDVPNNPALWSLHPIKNFSSGGWTLMTKLWAINVEGDNVSDLSSLDVVRGTLRWLNLKGNPVETLQPVFKMLNLEHLNISDTPITSFSILESCSYINPTLIVWDTPGFNRGMGPYYTDLACQTFDILEGRGWSIQENICE